MIRRIHCLLFLFAGLTCYSQSQVDSLRNMLTNTKGETKVDILNELAKSFQVSSADSIKMYANQAYEISKKIEYKRGQVQALWALGLSKTLVSNYDSSLIDFKKALTLSDSFTLSEIQANIYMGIGGVYYYQNVTDSALHYFIKAAEQFETLGLQKRLAAAYSNLGMIMNANGQDEQALYYFRNALKYARKHSLLNLELPLLVNLALYFDNLNQYDSALDYALSCYQISKQNDLKYGMGRALLVLPRVYAKLELFESSLTSAQEGIKLFELMGDDSKVRSMTYQEALALKGLKHYDQALERCELLLQNLEDTDPLKEHVYSLAYKINVELKNYKKALQYHEDFFRSYENASIERQKEQLTELETQYDTEKKSREIDSLNNESKLQEVRLAQKNILIIVGLSFFAIVILVLLLFNRQHNLKKQNEMLSLEQRFLRFQMNPHFIFNALGAIQKFVLTNNPIEGASFIAKFSSLIRQVLEHSRLEYIALDKEIVSLKNYLDLQKLRFENKFDYSIEVGSDIDQEEVHIPPMFAQPFIENALEHGVSTLSKKGEIRVRFSKSGNNIELIISDNGKGLETLASPSENHISLATTITNERMNKFKGLGNQAKLTIENIQNKEGNISGVQVSLLLPTK